MIRKGIIAATLLCLLLSGFKKPDWLTLASGKVTMKIDPQASGRIVVFAIDGNNVLASEAIHPFNYGSTLWPAPQSKWHWPPYPALDNDPYQVIRHEQNEIILQSKPDSISGLQFTKHYFLKNQQFHINYTITNISANQKQVAAWEVTRVDTTGRAFFPLSGQEALSQSSLQNTSIVNGYLWYEPDYHNMQNSQKYFGYGRDGYLAWVTGNVLFVKQFPDIAADQPAPEHAEVEIFAHAQYPYIELENHGPYQILQPGESLHYPVIWYLHKIDEEWNEKKIIDRAESYLKIRKN